MLLLVWCVRGRISRCRNLQMKSAYLDRENGTTEQQQQQKKKASVNFHHWKWAGKHRGAYWFFRRWQNDQWEERRRKLRRDEQFLQAGLCGLVAPSPPPPLHISLQTPAHFCCHLSKLACKFTFMQQLWCGIASCNLYCNVGVVVISVLFFVLLRKDAERHPDRSSSGSKDEMCLISGNHFTENSD